MLYSKGFPKEYSNKTTITDRNSYPLYRRKNNSNNEDIVNNAYVVPYNRKLLLKYTYI